MEWHEEEEALTSASITDEQLAVLAGTTDIARATHLQLTVDSVRLQSAQLHPRLEGMALAEPCAHSPL